MRTKQSPGGSIFPYYFKYGELFGMHLGSFFEDGAAMIKRMQAEEEFIRTENYPLPLWIDFYQTKLTDESAGRIFRKACCGCRHISQNWRLWAALCGLNGVFRKLARKNGFSFPDAAQVF